MIGSSTSSGSWPRTRDTRSRTSLAAASVARSGTNSTVICETSSRLTDLMVRTPSMPAMLSSSGCVTWDSITCGLAPLYTVRTETTGVSIFGYSRTVRRRNEMAPTRTMSRLITVERTGRLMESSGRNIRIQESGFRIRQSLCTSAHGFLRLHRTCWILTPGSRILVGQHSHRCSILEAKLAIDDDRVAGGETAADLDF